jgi:hypothetical protein
MSDLFSFLLLTRRFCVCLVLDRLEKVEVEFPVIMCWGVVGEEFSISRMISGLVGLSVVQRVMMFR